MFIRTLPRLIYCIGILSMIILLVGCDGATASQNVMRPSSSHAKHTAQKAVVKDKSATAQASANPAILRIPSIGVIAHVETLGALSDGDLATPTQSPWTDVGWYDVGTQPGKIGQRGH